MEQRTGLFGIFYCFKILNNGKCLLRLIFDLKKKEKKKKAFTAPLKKKCYIKLKFFYVSPDEALICALLGKLTLDEMLTKVSHLSRKGK